MYIRSYPSVISCGSWLTTASHIWTLRGETGGFMWRDRWFHLDIQNGFFFFLIPVKPRSDKRHAVSGILTCTVAGWAFINFSVLLQSLFSPTQTNL